MFIISVLLLIITGLIVYSNSFSGAFVFDDIFILNNHQIHHLWPLWDVILDTNRPLLNLSLAVNYSLGGIHVWGYHAFNLFVHIMASLVLFGILRRTLSSPRLQHRYADSSLGLSLIVALLWLVHPLQTESVTYIIQRAESLMGLFYLLTVYCAVRYIESSHQQRWMAAAVISCVLGLGCKEVTVTAPLIVLIYDRVFYADSFKDAISRRRKLYLGLFLTWVVLLVLLTQTKDYAGTAGFQFKGFTPLEYALTQPGVILHYLRLAFYPDALCLDYLWQPAGTAGAILPPAIGIGLLVGITLWMLRRRPAIGFLGAWFFLILSVTSSFIPIADMAFEHRMYLPLAAVAAVVVFTAEYLLQRLVSSHTWRRLIAISLTGITVIILGRITFLRNEDYRSEVTILRDVIKKRPGHLRATTDLGLSLIQEEKYEEGISYLNKAIQKEPRFEKPYNHIGLARYYQGRYEEAGTYFFKALDLNPEYDEAHNNMGLIFVRQGEFEKAKQHYAKAMELNPHYAEAYNNMGSMLLDLREYEEAKGYLFKAVKIKPHYETPYNNLGAVSIHQGRLSQAKTYLTKALQLKPDYAKALNNLGVVFKLQGRREEARDYFVRALKLNPDYPAAQRNLAEVSQPLMTIPQPGRARAKKE